MSKLTGNQEFNGDVYIKGIGGYDGTNPSPERTLQKLLSPTRRLRFCVIETAIIPDEQRAELYCSNSASDYTIYIEYFNNLGEVERLQFNNYDVTVDIPIGCFVAYYAKRGNTAISPMHSIYVLASFSEESFHAIWIPRAGGDYGPQFMFALSFNFTIMQESYSCYIPFCCTTGDIERTGKELNEALYDIQSITFINAPEIVWTDEFNENDRYTGDPDESDMDDALPIGVAFVNATNFCILNGEIINNKKSLRTRSNLFYSVGTAPIIKTYSLAFRYQVSDALNQVLFSHDDVVDSSGFLSFPYIPSSIEMSFIFGGGNIQKYDEGGYKTMFEEAFDGLGVTVPTLNANTPGSDSFLNTYFNGGDKNVLLLYSLY